jgi:hypothetical protein
LTNPFPGDLEFLSYFKQGLPLLTQLEDTPHPLAGP